VEADFHMTVDSIAGVLLVAVAGMLDPGSCRQLDECLQRAVRGRREVVVDLSEAENMPQRAIDALIAARERLGVRLRVVVPREGAAFAGLRRAGVHHTLAIHASEASALTAARTGGAGSARGPRGH
jgi:anti-anti-sigma regulatory factor